MSAQAALLRQLLLRALPRRDQQLYTQEDTLTSRISDPRALAPDSALAMIIDLLCACATPNDLDFMFPELSHIAESTWRVPVDQHRSLRFEWVADLGATNIRLE